MSEGSEGQIPSNTGNKEKPPINIYEEYLKARDIGAGVMVLYRESRSQNYSHEPRYDLFPQDMLKAVNPVTTSEEIAKLTEADVQAAKVASFGLALETARQVAEDAFVKTGKARADIKWWETLGRIISDSRYIAQDLIDTNPTIYRSTVLRIAAAASGKTPEEIDKKVSDERLDQWVKAIYTDSRNSIGRKVELLNAYLRT